jgi:hypothetical protein
MAAVAVVFLLPARASSILAVEEADAGATEVGGRLAMGAGVAAW